MTSEDWRTVLLAARPMLMAATAAIGSAGAILVGGGSWQAACGAGFCSFSAIYFEVLRRKSDQVSDKADVAAKKADTAAVKAVNAEIAVNTTNSLINGRMDQLLAAEREKAFAAGKAEGIAAVTKAVGDSPNVSMEGRDIAKAVAAVVDGKPDSSKGV